MASSEETSSKLTARQELFIQEYLIDLNATKAAIRAGYSESNAGSYSSDLMADPRVSQRIATALAQRETRVGMTREQVLQEMSLLANSRIEWFEADEDGNVVLTDKAPEGAMGCIQSVKRKFQTRTDREGNVFKTVDVEIKLWDKPAPLKLMGRHVGLFPDKIELTGKDGKPLEMVHRVERVIVDPNQKAS